MYRFNVWTDLIFFYSEGIDFQEKHPLKNPFTSSFPFSSYSISSSYSSIPSSFSLSVLHSSPLFLFTPLLFYFFFSFFLICLFFLFFFFLFLKLTLFINEFSKLATLFCLCLNQWKSIDFWRPAAPTRIDHSTQFQMERKQCCQPVGSACNYLPLLSSAPFLLYSSPSFAY